MYQAKLMRALVFGHAHRVVALLIAIGVARSLGQACGGRGPASCTFISGRSMPGRRGVGQVVRLRCSAVESNFTGEAAAVADLVLQVHRDVEGRSDRALDRLIQAIEREGEKQREMLQGLEDKLEQQMEGLEEKFEQQREGQQREGLLQGMEKLREELQVLKYMGILCLALLGFQVILTQLIKIL
jgi:hypothetical protein